MWYRGSLAWQTILAADAIATASSDQEWQQETASVVPTPPTPSPASAGPEPSSSARGAVTKPASRPRHLLVVAHNNTNQALIATALGLPCTYFRRMLQNNAALSCVELRPSTVAWDAPPEV